MKTTMPRKIVKHNPDDRCTWNMSNSKHSASHHVTHICPDLITRIKIQNTSQVTGCLPVSKDLANSWVQGRFVYIYGVHPIKITPR